MSFADIGPWQVYRLIFRLLSEGYISEHSVVGTPVSVLQLTKKGFLEVVYDLGSLKEKRFNPQSITHDYWATAFQLSPFMERSTTGVSFICEQELQALEAASLPEWIPDSRDHVPDGFTCIKNGENESHIAIEVELNLKPLLRYDKAAYYFNALESPIDMVFWLCGNISLAEAIFDRLAKANLRDPYVHHFFLTEDFRSLGWQAPARSGHFRNKSIHEILIAKGWQCPSSKIAKQWQGEISEIFFPKAKSPLKKMT